MFGFVFGKKAEGVSLAEALAGKDDEALRRAAEMLGVPADGARTGEETRRLIAEQAGRKWGEAETLLLGLPDFVWKTVSACLEKGPQPLAAPAELDGEIRQAFLSELAKMYAGLFFMHVLPAGAEAEAPRVAAVEELRRLWKDRRRDLLDRRARWDRVCALAQGAANLYGCLDVARFRALAGGAVPEGAGEGEVEEILAARTQLGDDACAFCCRDGEILHRDLADDGAAHARIRRAHVGKAPLAVTADGLAAWADDGALLRTDAFRAGLRAFAKALPKPLAAEAEDIASGFARACRKGDDVEQTMRQLVALAETAGGGSVDCSGLTPIYNATPLWAEFGRSREQAGTARDFSLGGPSSAGRPQVNDGPQVGRNDPCPCGSGKKFKKCCGRGL